MKLFGQTVGIVFFTIVAILIWRFEFCIFGCSRDPFIGVDLLIVFIGLITISYILRGKNQIGQSEKENLVAKRGKGGLILFFILLMQVVAISAFKLESQYRDYYENGREENITAWNIVDRPVGFVSGLPIAIEFEYSTHTKPPFLPSIYKILYGKELGIFYPIIFNPNVDEYQAHHPGYYLDLMFKSVSPTPNFPDFVKKSDLEAEGLMYYLDSADFELGKTYKIVVRILPAFFGILKSDIALTESQEQFMKEFGLRGPICVKRIPSYQSLMSSPEEAMYSQLSFGMHDIYQATTTNSYSLNEFYNNAIASGIPFCD